MSKPITIYVHQDDPDLKAQIADLGKEEGSIYFGRTESVIAKMLLKDSLDRINKNGGHK